MGSIIANIKKTAYYLKRNGLKNTWDAVAERLGGSGETYVFTETPADVLENQRAASGTLSDIRVSIVVPAFRTPEQFLRRMIDSVLNQTYPKLELILADASDTDSVEQVVKTYSDERLVYHRLAENAGISQNTNEGLKFATGDYVGLLDHDDILTPDALYEMVSMIENKRRQGIELQMLYSDEDKCDGEETAYFEPNFKEDFNLDLLLSNNYICHFLMMKRELMQSLGFRGEYDGAQDFDLVLRAAFALSHREECIAHVGKVLYHWRCHSASTAENPQSKRYAYEAGMRATADFAAKKGWKVQAKETKHLGFYRYEYAESPLSQRTDLGAIGGPVIHRNRIIGGRMDEEGKVYYENLPVNFSGYLHRASLQQDALALDLRNIELKEALYPLFQEVVGVPYKKDESTGRLDVSILPQGADTKELAIALGRAIRQKGFRLLYLPDRQ
ncbi:MAG: glycosyltransferase [Acetatifactor sp.]|nr:glycosyltransferase [Acetatifactor sp.]